MMKVDSHIACLFWLLKIKGGDPSYRNVKVPEAAHLEKDGSRYLLKSSLELTLRGT